MSTYYSLLNAWEDFGFKVRKMKCFRPERYSYVDSMYYWKAVGRIEAIEEIKAMMPGDWPEPLLAHDEDYQGVDKTGWVKFKDIPEGSLIKDVPSTTNGKPNRQDILRKSGNFAFNVVTGVKHDLTHGGNIPYYILPDGDPFVDYVWTAVEIEYAARERFKDMMKLDLWKSILTREVLKRVFEKHLELRGSLLKGEI